MSDQAPEPTDTDTSVQLPPALGGEPTPEPMGVLDLEHVLSSARLVEKVAKICTRADLEAKLLDTLEELATLVDGEGNVLEQEEAALGGNPNEARARVLSDLAQELRAEMAENTFTVRFRALNSDAWDEFNKAHRNNEGKAKNLNDYNNRLIAATAIEPTMTVAEVAKLRTVLAAPQMVEMADAAFKACTTGGLDVPKLPRFSHVPKPAE